MATRVSLSRIGFLLTCFLLPGLIGAFASFSIPAPVVDETHQQAALDAVLAAPTPATQQAAIARLGRATDPDTAALVRETHGPLAPRVAAATQNMRAEVLREARAEALRIRELVIALTLAGALMGVALLLIGSAEAPRQSR